MKDKISSTYVPFTVKYKLDDLPLIISETPVFRATTKLSGDTVITLAHKVPLYYVTNKGMELNYKGEADKVLRQLISEPDLSWDAASGKISLISGFPFSRK